MSVTGMVCKSQLNEIFRKLLCLMNSVGGALCDICYVHLYVSDMTLFGDINEEYTQWFGSSPPSRSCVMVNDLFLFLPILIFLL